MNHKIIRKVQHLIFFALFKLNIITEIRKKKWVPAVGNGQPHQEWFQICVAIKPASSYLRNNK